MLSFHIAFRATFSTFSYSEKNVIMAIKDAKFSLLYCHCWWHTFFLLINSQFCCEISSYDERNLWNWLKILFFQFKDFLMKKIYVLLFNLRQVNLIPPSVSSTCCAVEAILVIQKLYRSPYLLELSWRYRTI